MTKVINIKSGEPYDIYIGRAEGPYGKWGNPFRIGRDGTRKEVVQKYAEYIQKKLDLLASLPELKNKTLGCYCKPELCHGDILVELVNKL